VLLLAFVVAVATMPPVQVTRNPQAAIGYQVRVDTGTWQQTFLKYRETVSGGTLGTDRAGHPVGPLVADRLANSLKLMGLALLVALVPGVLKGLWDFRQIRSGRLAIGPALTGVVQGMPDFWLVMVVQLGAVKLYQYYAVRPFPPIYDDAFPVRSLVAPVLCLAMIPWAYVARITSTAMQTIWEKEFIRTARAKGLHESAVTIKHALMAAVVPILDGLPNALTVMCSNLLIVEYLFRYPGMTILLRDAVSAPPPGVDIRRPLPAPDVPVLVAAGVTLGLVFWLVHMLILVLRRAADPRLKEGGQS
jgi:peptide/nickel transport system permease protein